MTKELKNWYPNDEAKRNFGFICRSLSLNQSVQILGTEREPLITMTKFSRDAPYVGVPYFITVTQLIADWSNITHAIMLLDAKIHLDSYNNLMQLKATKNCHGALKYKHTCASFFEV
jgi:hypothetical protein